MLNTNDKVKVLPYKGHRSIFNNADVTPGETVTHPGGQIGFVHEFMDSGGYGDTATITSLKNGEGEYIGEWLLENLQKL